MSSRLLTRRRLGRWDSLFLQFDRGIIRFIFWLCLFLHRIFRDSIGFLGLIRFLRLVSSLALSGNLSTPGDGLDGLLIDHTGWLTGTNTFV